MEIVIEDIASTVLDPRRHLSSLNAIREICRAKPDGYQYMPRFRSGRWDGYISLMFGFNSFPTGLLKRIVDKMQELGDPVTLYHKHDKTVPGIVKENDLHGITLRDYQVEAANNLLQARRGIAKMATNSGKTEVMAAMIKVMKMRTIVLVHRQELMYQTAERFKERGLLNVGIAGDGKYEKGKIMVAMIQTLFNNIGLEEFYLETIQPNQMLFIDECHHLSSDQTLSVFNTIPGFFRFGMSGTPLKHDRLSDLKLMGATGEIETEITNDYLVEHGYSAKPTIYIAVVENALKKAWKEKYAAAYDAYLVGNGVRNMIIRQFALEESKNGSVLILVNKLDHGRFLQDIIDDSVFVSGQESTEFRQDILRRMREGNGIFIASPIFDEGVDVPAVGSVVLAGGGESQIRLLQRIGRGLRSKGGKNELHVLDFIDDTNKYLLEHSNMRIQTYEQEGFATVMYKPDAKIG